MLYAGAILGIPMILSGTLISHAGFERFLARLEFMIFNLTISFQVPKISRHPTQIIGYLKLIQNLKLTAVVPVRSVVSCPKQLSR